MNDDPTRSATDEPNPEVEPLTLDVAPSAEPSEVAVVAPAPALEVIDTASSEGLPPELAEPPASRDDLTESLGRRVEALAESLGTRLDALQASFEREVRAEATREKVVDRLHAELQEYKQDLLLSILRPVFIDLIQLHDDLGKLAEALPDDAPVEPARVRAMLEDAQQGIEDVLYRQGVEPYRVESESFDPRRQRAVATVETDDPALGKILAARLRKGFQSGDKVIRPELVSVHALKKGDAR